MGIPHGTHVKSNRMVPSLKSQVSNLLLLVCRLSPVACRLSPVACRLSPLVSRVSRLASRLAPSSQQARLSSWGDEAATNAAESVWKSASASACVAADEPICRSGCSSRHALW